MHGFGYLISNALYVFKRPQNADPVVPELEMNSGRIVITNAKNAQEYYVSTERMTVTVLESRWKDARSPNSNGNYTLN